MGAVYLVLKDIPEPIRKGQLRYDQNTECTLFILHWFDYNVLKFRIYCSSELTNKVNGTSFGQQYILRMYESQTCTLKPIEIKQYNTSLGSIGVPFL